MNKILVMAMTSVIGFGQTQTTIKRTPMEYAPVQSGEEMYGQYCSSCHGIDGKGKGPAAAALREAMPDLTKMAQNNGGEFPAMSVMMTLGRIEGPGAHGSQEMPVWGSLFRRSGQNEATVQLRLYNLTRYLEAMQDPPSRKVAKVHKSSMNAADVNPASGASMYAMLCSNCHGETGLGDGPTAVSLKSMPSDLTMLSRANGGNFPMAKVREILDRAPGTAAHGSAEMPIWGNVFRGTGEDPSVVKLRIYNLTNYLRALQR